MSAVLLAMSFLFAAGAPTATPFAREPWCWDVRGAITVSFSAGDCASVVGLCTQGVIDADGFLEGTTRYTATGIGGGVAGETSIVTPPAEPPSTWTYAGELLVTTALGTLRMNDVGVLDTAHGLFTELDRVLDGTGLYEGATGTLYMFGTTYPDGSGFEGDVRGRLCLPTAPPPKAKARGGKELQPHAT